MDAPGNFLDKSHSLKKIVYVQHKEGITQVTMQCFCYMYDGFMMLTIDCIHKM